MGEPFEFPHIHQDDLEKQWLAFQRQGGLPEVNAYRLARFVEARIIVKARAEIERLQKVLADMDMDVRPPQGETREDIDRGMRMVAYLVLMAIIALIILVAAGLLLWLASQTGGGLP